MVDNMSSILLQAQSQSGLSSRSAPYIPMVDNIGTTPLATVPTGEMHRINAIDTNVQPLASTFDTAMMDSEIDFSASLLNSMSDEIPDLSNDIDWLNYLNL